MAFENQQHLVPFFDSVLDKHICRFITVFFHITEAEYPLVSRLVAPRHCPAIWFLRRNDVNNIISKVEVIRAVNFKFRNHAVFIKFFGTKLFMQFFYIHVSPFLSVFCFKTCSERAKNQTV